MLSTIENILDSLTIVDLLFKSIKFRLLEENVLYKSTILQKGYSRNETYVSIHFISINAEGESVNKFFGFISNPNQLTISLPKFVLINFGSAGLDKLSLNYYSGSVEDKVNACIGFLYEVLAHEELIKVYEGNYWNDAYYAPLWEGTNR